MIRSKFSKTAFQLIEINSFPRLSKKRFLSLPFTIFTFFCFIRHYDYFTKRDYVDKSTSDKEQHQTLGPYVYPSS